MELSVAFVALLTTCVTCLLLFWKGKGQNRKGLLPPGPRPLPIVGNLFQLDSNMLKTLLEWRERYGSVYTIYLGSQPFVVLCGYQAVKEALVDRGEQFSDRGDFPLLFRYTQGDGVAYANGEKWKVLRRFSVQTLRDFGMGRRSIEERIQEEAQCVVEELAKTKEEPVDHSFLISCSVSNVICSIIFGDRFDYKDEKFLTLVGLVNDNFRCMSSWWGQMYNLFPHVMYYLPGPHNRIFENFEKLDQFILEMTKTHQETLDPNFPRDFIDCFLLKMQQEKEKPSAYFYMNSLVKTTLDVFFGGTETTSTTLRFGILILLKYPDMQAKVYEEISRVVGPHRSPLFGDRVQMPYTEAFLHEVQRLADILPMGIPRAVTTDTHFRGYVLPKGTNVIPVLYSVHKDVTQFKDPEAFDPTHFLDEKGGFRRCDAFMPFSAGKRMCFGEPLVHMELFLFLTTLVQRFTLQPLIPTEEIHISSRISDLGKVRRTYKFRAIPR
ncbi:cytochrome P450 2F2-like [Heteronotia binoei]|uniref:cytochrome P450 2F2-like n=1 Tax=Heteronotia binoei TaxID=13085 RepID=UPI00292F0604|nr:cytochrome P450 2F2-like [Heteronotia binoei]XP_060114376.1 cytochrome P450 2F2-like [Heteronotia binoei]